MMKNLTNVRGFTCWGAHVGIKSMRRDLALIHSEVPAAAAAVFTQNLVVAEPIRVSREHLANGVAQTIVCNSGNANACTGEDGLAAARAMAEETAQGLGIDPQDVIVASTGIIGEPFPTELVLEGIRDNLPKLSSRATAGSLAASAILTTDTFPKEGFIEFSLDDTEINMGAMAKGSGMIHPNMATMLAFIVTDAAIDANVLQQALRTVNEKTFNCITVDGDTSTNDMVAILANGKAQNDRIDSTDHPDFALFQEKLEEMMDHLSRLIVSDGEGASKVIQYTVHGAPSSEAARRVVRGVSTSLLVKTAMFGRDPNWGRILAAAGNSGVPFDPASVDLQLGNMNTLVDMLLNGRPQDFDRNVMKKLMRDSHLRVVLDLKAGEASAKGLGSDLTTDYVMFNSVYTT